jgi:hypothetical protein
MKQILKEHLWRPKKQLQGRMKQYRGKKSRNQVKYQIFLESFSKNLFYYNRIMHRPWGEG